MTSRKPRNLRPEEQQLWDKVRQSAVPLHVPQKTILAEAVENIAPPKAPPVIPTFRVGQNAAPQRQPAGFGQTPPLQMDSKQFARMRKGKLRPEARIDLHGMTLAQAHPALTEFILWSRSRGCRLVLVITGKGRSGRSDIPSPVRVGVMRHQVPQWLRQGAVGSVVQQVSDAHVKHGGSGALYVYLRRNR